jgi:hypothetical protein
MFSVPWEGEEGGGIPTAIYCSGYNHISGFVLKTFFQELLEKINCYRLTHKLQCSARGVRVRAALEGSHRWNPPFSLFEAIKRQADEVRGVL